MRTITILRWTGRILSAALALFLIVLSVKLFTEEKHFSRGDWFDLVFLLLLVPGLILSLFREKAGIILSLAGVAGFVLYDAIVFGVKPGTYILLTGAFPSILLLICSLAEDK